MKAYTKICKQCNNIFSPSDRRNVFCSRKCSGISQRNEKVYIEKPCKNCGIVHDGTFGNGEFCSRKCSNTRNHSEDTKNNIRMSMTEFFEKVEPAKKREYTDRLKEAIEFATFRKKEIRQNKILYAPFDTLAHSHKRIRIYNEQCEKCALCGVGKIYNGKELKLELDHVDGDRTNETRENLRLICPNCHSQTPTYKSKNCINKKVEDSEIIEALKTSVSGYKTLQLLGMNLHGGNYVRMRNIIKKYDLKLNYTV